MCRGSSSSQGKACSSLLHASTASKSHSLMLGGVSMSETGVLFRSRMNCRAYRTTIQCISGYCVRTFWNSSAANKSKLLHEVLTHIPQVSQRVQMAASLRNCPGSTFADESSHLPELTLPSLEGVNLMVLFDCSKSRLLLTVKALRSSDPSSSRCRYFKTPSPVTERITVQASPALNTTSAGRVWWSAIASQHTCRMNMLFFALSKWKRG
mmetsp:Transcript_138566/g.276246  ORF Transcript_138566/g.276246 Transcript_138566/m.276246 type:complete len:210 (+) Transcript_138566:248-877(+)